MRRKDREVSDPAAIDAVIRACDCCRLGFRDGDGVYILPLNFGFTHEGGKRVFYFHGASEGKKIDLVRAQPHVGFELDGGHRVNPAESPCGYSFAFRSVIGQGDVRLVTDPAERDEGLRLIMAHYSPRKDWTFPAAAMEKTAIIRLDVTELSCKVHD